MPAAALRRGRRRRGRGTTALVLLAVIAGLLVAADATAKAVAEDELADRLRASVPARGGTKATIHAFPFLPRLLADGEVAQVDAAVSDLTVRGLRFDVITIALHGVRLDRRRLVEDRQVVLNEIERGEARAEVSQDALSDVIGVPVTLETGRASVTVAGRRVAAELAVRDGRLVVAGVGVTLPGVELVAPLLPCVPDAEIVPGRVLLTCEFTEIPEELLPTDLRAVRAVRDLRAVPAL